MINIKVDVRGFSEVQAELARIGDEVGRGKAVAAALNRTAERARTEVNRAITERYAIKADEVRSSISLRSARSGVAQLQAVIDVFGSPTKKGRSMNVARFLAAVQAAGGTHKLRGAKVSRAQMKDLAARLGFQFTKSGGLKTIAGAFLGNNGRTVFRRVGKARLPIEPVQVVGVSQMFNQRAIRARVMAKIDADLPVQMKRAVDMILARSA